MVLPVGIQDTAMPILHPAEDQLRPTVRVLGRSAMRTHVPETIVPLKMNITIAQDERIVLRAEWLQHPLTVPPEQLPVYRLAVA